MDIKQWSVYCLFHPQDRTAIRYVGITSQALTQRLNEHMRLPEHNKALRDWLRRLAKAGLIPGVTLLETLYGTRPQAERKEQEYIYCFLSYGHDLLNSKHIKGDKKRLTAHLITLRLNDAMPYAALISTPFNHAAPASTSVCESLHTEPM